MHIAHRFWPSDRKLFRQRSRWRVLVPSVAIVAVLALAITLGPIGWR